MFDTGAYHQENLNYWMKELCPRGNKNMLYLTRVHYKCLYLHAITIETLEYMIQRKTHMHVQIIKQTCVFTLRLVRMLSHDHVFLIMD